MSMLGFQTLRCPKCDRTHVTTVSEIVWQEGKGTALKPVGHYCLKCMLPFDNEGAIKAIKTKELEDRIKELQVQNGR